MRGYDPDGDSLVFGVTGAGAGLVRVEARDEYSADVFLRQDLDHEVGVMMSTWTDVSAQLNNDNELNEPRQSSHDSGNL